VVVQGAGRLLVLLWKESRGTRLQYLFTGVACCLAPIGCGSAPPGQFTSATTSLVEQSKHRHRDTVWRGPESYLAGQNRHFTLHSDF